MTLKEIFDSVCQHFDGDVHKTNIWFSSPNPGLGGITPFQLLIDGHYTKLVAFIAESLDANKS